MCKGVALEVQGKQIVQPFFLLELGGVDVVLGTVWLSSLGNIVANFQNVTICWKKNGTAEGITGDPTLCKAKASWKAALGEGYFITSFEPGKEKDAGKVLSMEFQQLLEEFEDICQAPTGLPPPREHDHTINLREGAAIPHVRPYRYPYV